MDFIHGWWECYIGLTVLEKLAASIKVERFIYNPVIPLIDLYSTEISSPTIELKLPKAINSRTGKCMVDVVGRIKLPPRCVHPVNMLLHSKGELRLQVGPTDLKINRLIWIIY